MHAKGFAGTLYWLLLAFALALTSAASADGANKSVRSFVMTRYEHGVPYAEAHAYGPHALPELARMLDDPVMKPHWRRVVTTIAYIGAPRSFRILKAFMWERFRGTVDNETWKALLNVPNVMGVIPDSPDARVIEYLEAGTNPAFWDSLPWTERSHAGWRDLSIILSEVSINGLACTGTQRAARVLARLEQRPFSARQLPNIRDGIRINRLVARDGIAQYLKQARAKLGLPRDVGPRK